MLDTILTYATNPMVVGSVCLVIGVMFGQALKDWLFGVHPGLRSAIRSVEHKAKRDIEAAVADILSKLPTLPDEAARQVAETAVKADAPKVDA
jgi:hypothetical protein